MIKAILQHISDLVKFVLDANNLNYEIKLFPQEVDLVDKDKLYVFVDIDSRTFSKVTTNDYVCRYDVKIGLAKVVDDYGDYIDAIDNIEKLIIEEIMRKVMVSEVRTGDYVFDPSNQTAMSSITVTVGFS